MSRGIGPADDPVEDGSQDAAREPSPGREEAGESGGDEGAMVRAVTARAIRRLDMLEYVILGAAAVMAALAGALVAWLVASVTAWSFGILWLVASVVLFVVPALVAWSRGRSGATGSSSTSGPDGV